MCGRSATVADLRELGRRYFRRWLEDPAHEIEVAPIAREILAEAKGSSILTISEIDRFGYFGGIVTLTMEGPRVRFEINLNAAEQAHLKISSKLLKLARVTGSNR